MKDEKRTETVAEIVAMLRRFANGNELPTDEIPSFTSLADRIDAAWRREILVERHLADEHIAAMDTEIESLKSQLRACGEEIDALRKEARPIRRDEAVRFEGARCAERRMKNAYA